eukprot:TRINITY_DN75698_c0_g1_i1.p1 TRINITY_DN75698_c0_g1~~TRINITY_DN75698_c0_g1_i1.p1  ORF type:complete len:486 (-),score=60.61 TRINITY_DN75698_c0_g1_i1:244-1701(-)
MAAKLLMGWRSRVFLFPSRGPCARTRVCFGVGRCETVRQCGAISRGRSCQSFCNSSRGGSLLDSVDVEKIYQGTSFAEISFAWAMLVACERRWLLEPSIWLLRRALENSSWWGMPMLFAVRRFVFPHYCAGEAIEDCHRVAARLRLAGVRLAVDRSQEEQERPEYWSLNLKGKQDLIQRVGTEFGDIVSFVPFKATSIMSPALLERMSEIVLGFEDWYSSIVDPIPHLSEDEMRLFQEAENNLAALCSSAKACGISLWLDAEQSHRQPAIDVLARRMMRRFNIAGCKPVLFNTYQLYLVGADARLQRDMTDSHRNGYCFAAKCVRGAYMVAEAERAVSTGSKSPIHASKVATDVAFDGAVARALRAIAAGQDVVVAICSHNVQSISAAISLMSDVGIERETQRVHFAQILGMMDHATNALGYAGYQANKLVLFGTFEDVFPWLLRRLDENRDMLGACQSERPFLRQEVVRRLRLRVGLPGTATSL